MYTYFTRVYSANNSLKELVSAYKTINFGEKYLKFIET